LFRRAEDPEKIMDVAPLALFVAHDPDCHEVTGNRTANWLAEAAEGTSVLPFRAWRSGRPPEVFSRRDLAAARTRASSETNSFDSIAF
jgi:hypothetical protein